MRKILALSVCLLASLTAQGTTLVPGGTVPATTLSYPTGQQGNQFQVGFFDAIFTTQSFSAHYAVQVFADPNNVFCPGCLDFVYSLGSLTSGQVSDFSVGNFGGYHTSVGYSAPQPPGVAPTSISRGVDGNLIDFAFGTPIIITPTGSQFSDQMVIQTDARNFLAGTGFGTLTGVPTLIPVPTPEPGTLMLIGTGLVGLAGAARKKLRS